MWDLPGQESEPVCIARRTLNHWTTREAPSAGFCLQSEGDDQTVLLREAKKMWRKRDMNGMGARLDSVHPSWQRAGGLMMLSRAGAEGRCGLVSAGPRLGVMQGRGNQG